LHTQFRVALSLLGSVTQVVQTVKEEQVKQGNTHVPQEAVLFSKNPALLVQLGEFSLLAGQEVQLDEVPEHSAH